LISGVKYFTVSEANVIWYNLDGTGWSLHKEGEISIVSPEYQKIDNKLEKRGLSSFKEITEKLKEIIFKAS